MSEMGKVPGTSLRVPVWHTIGKALSTEKVRPNRNVLKAVYISDIFIAIF